MDKKHLQNPRKFILNNYSIIIVLDTNNKITYLVTGQLQQAIIIINKSYYSLFRIRY